MSRLAEAEAKLAAALQQLESALASRPAAPATVDDSGDREAIITEIERIDEQLSSAIQMIDRARQTAGSEGGTA